MNKQLIFAGSLILLLQVMPSVAVTTWKGSASGNWDIPTNWAGGFPQSNSTVRLNHDRQTNAYTVVINAPAITDKLWIDTYGAIPIHLRVDNTGSLRLHSMRMGFKAEDRKSSFAIDGGSVWGMEPTDSNVTNTSFLIGNNPDCFADLQILNNGTLSVLGSNGLIVASSKESIGRLTVTNSSMQIKDSLTLGKGPNSYGELMISGTSSVSITNALHIAKLDSGILYPTGMVHVAGGLLECGTLNVAANGIGTFMLQDGHVRVFNGGITLGQSTSTARLNISGGTMETVGSSMNIGHTDSSGTLFMVDGLLNIDGAITLGSSSRSRGILELRGGILSADQLVIGEAISSTASVYLRAGEFELHGTDHDALQILNGELHVEQALIQWNNPNVTDWITDAISNDLIFWSNGFAHGTYSTNGFDGSVSNQGSTLYWDNLENGSAFTRTVIWVEESPYNTWVRNHHLSETDALWSADPDHDGLDNLTEFGLGGNPTLGAESGILPILRTEGQPLEYVHRQRTDPSAFGLQYVLEQTPDLTSPSWSTNGFTPHGTSPEIDGFIVVNHTIPSGSFTNLFIRLRIERE